MIQSVNRTLDIMTFVSNNHGVPVTISEISKTTGINKSTCCHIIETLVNRGFLNQVSRSSGYVLGVYAYNLTRYKDFHRDLILTSMPILRWIQNKTGYTTVLANLIEGEKFVLCYADNPNNSLSQKGDIYKGTLYDSATGRAMLSSMKTNELKRVVSKAGLPTDKEWKGINSFEALERKLKQIEKDNIVKVEFVDGNNYIYKYAIPILAPKQERFAIGIEIKSNKEPSNKDLKYAEDIMIVATKELMRRMKFIDANK